METLGAQAVLRNDFTFDESMLRAASQMMPDEVYTGAVFLFVGRRFDTVKALRWDRNGFAVWHKVIESREKYYWPRMLSEEVVAVSVEQLNWLLDGYDVWRQPHQMLRLLHVN